MSINEAFEKFSRICRRNLSDQNQCDVIDAVTVLVIKNRRLGLICGLVAGFLAGSAIATVIYVATT